MSQNVLKLAQYIIPFFQELTTFHSFHKQSFLLTKIDRKLEDFYSYFHLFLKNIG